MSKTFNFHRTNIILYILYRLYIFLIDKILFQEIPYLISAHTNLDLSSDGTNTAMFNALELQDMEQLEIDGGLIGSLKIPMYANEFANFIKVKFNCDGLRFSDCGEKICRVALVAGAGGEGIFLAKAKNAQAFVTGEIKHHEVLFARQNNIAIFAVGQIGRASCRERV